MLGRQNNRHERKLLQNEIPLADWTASGLKKVPRGSHPVPNQLDDVNARPFLFIGEFAKLNCRVELFIILFC